jgi:hypothetical protein
MLSKTSAIATGSLFLLCFAGGAGAALILDGMPLESEAMGSAPASAVRSVGPGHLPVAAAPRNGASADEAEGRCLRAGDALTSPTPKDCRRFGGVWTTKRAGITGAPSSRTSQRSLRRTVP